MIVIENTTCTIQNSNRSSLIVGSLNTWSYRSNRYSLNIGPKTLPSPDSELSRQLKLQFQLWFFFFFLGYESNYWETEIGLLVVTAGVESNGSEESKTGGRGQRWGPRRFVFFRTGQVYVISVNSGGFNSSWWLWESQREYWVKLKSVGFFYCIWGGVVSSV